MASSFFVSDRSDALLRFLPENASWRNTLTGPIFILTTSGQAAVEIDGRPYLLSMGALLTLLPSHRQHTVLFEKDYSCLVLAFEFDDMADFPYMLSSRISEKMGHVPFIQLSPEERKRLEDWYHVIIHHNALTSHPSYKEILRSLVFIFTAEVSAIYTNSPIKATATHQEALTNHFFHLLHEFFSIHRDAAFYAGQLCITPKYLARVIQQVTGHTPSYWMVDFTIREAKMLLKSTTLTVTQLSERLNFPNSSFFARYFKRYAGVAPQEYRFSIHNDTVNR